jgi:uncharacterized membrane protein YccC
MTLPGPRDWLFSVKTFAGAMAAIWIAMWIGLDRPYWALATSYIVAQPLTGAMRSKAVYRLLGTLVGLIATLVLVPNLVDAPEVLTAALALWVGVCIYFAVLDRTPRSYVFLLAGYTAALVGFPIVDAPGTIWDVAIARAEEIALGIICTTFVGTILFPAALGPTLTARLDGWMQTAADWAIGVLSGEPENARTADARRRVASDAVEIGMLTTFIAYDTSNLQTATQPVDLLRQRLVILLPAISGIADRLAALRESDGIPASLRSLLDRLIAWIATGRHADLTAADQLRAEIDALKPAINVEMGWTGMTLSGVLLRLRDLVDLVHDVIALRRQVAAGSPHLPELAMPAAETRGLRGYRDHLMALHSAVASVVAIGLLTTWWIATAWPEGSGAAALGAVAAAFFAAQDDPVPNILSFLLAATIALMIDAFLLFVLLPQVYQFESLMLVLAMVFLPLGAFISMPATARAAGPIAFIGATQLALSNGYSADFASYLNNSLASIAGLAATAVIIAVVRSVSAEWTAQRLLRTNRADIARAALNPDPASRIRFMSLLLDRLTLVVPRLAANAEGDAAAMAALASIRVGVNVVDLRQDLDQLATDARDAVTSMLNGVAAYYREPAEQPGSLALLHAIDHAIEEVMRDSSDRRRSILLQIGGIRRGLFRNVPLTTGGVAAITGQATREGIA